MGRAKREVVGTADLQDLRRGRPHLERATGKKGSHRRVKAVLGARPDGGRPEPPGQTMKAAVVVPKN